MGSMTHVHFADKTLAGVPELLHDLQQLMVDEETADLVFIVGKDKVHFPAHRLILWARCHNLRRVGREFWVTSPNKSRMSISYSNYEPDIFQAVLTYVYTGKIILQDLTVFTVLAIAQELGIPALEEGCERHISGTLSVHNACGFYAAAVQMEEELSLQDFRKPEHRFSQTCAKYIEENAEQITKTEGWLELPKSVITKLLTSDSFALEEEEVWRAVLCWAKYHAGVPLERAPPAWNVHEKALVCQALSGVINHVKLLLIDSTVFAEEVEPTGAVPMELSLERYRFAAVPDKFSQTQDKRLRPRVSHKLFQGTQILTNDKLQYQRLLNTWFGESKQVWRLLYRASRDGFSAEQFHGHCDGHSPTFVIVLGTTGNICGGYSDVPWTSKTSTRGRYIPSNKAFLFTLVNQQGVSPTKYSIVIPQYATVHHPSFGPIFGAGADLSISNNCQSGMESYSNMPHSYDGDNASSSILMGDYNFNVLDYEVFTPVEQG